MGLISRLKGWFGKEDPEEQLNAFIESATEKLREFEVVVNRAESERLTARERLKRYETEIRFLRSQAETYAEQLDEESARRMLEQAHEKKQLAEQLAADMEPAEKSVAMLREQFLQMTKKLNEVKANRQAIVQRNRNAAARKDAFLTMSKSEDPLKLLGSMQEDPFLAEAEAELAGKRETSLDDEFEKLRRNAAAANDNTKMQ